ncbi:MAG: tRNA pseudouridine(55) synthase TruB [Acidimicrobiales bacterium]
MIDGLALVDKEPGWTSHDVVAKVRRLLGQRRVGHAGTLDPGATGLLLIGLGRATRLLRFLSGQPKRYVGEVVLGVTTSTLDADGDVTARFDMGAITLDDVDAAAAALTGPILQVPPMVSAVRVDGRRLHQLARQGIEVERQARPVTIHRLVVRPTTEPGVFGIDVSCSSGTYVRSLAADLGAALGGGAHLRALRRLSIGSFDVDQAVTVEGLCPERVLPPAEALRDMPSVTVEGEVAREVAHGAMMEPAALAPAGLDAAALGPAALGSGRPAGLAGTAGPAGPAGDGPWAVLDRSGELLAVYSWAGEPGGRVKPLVVLARRD